MLQASKSTLLLISYLSILSSICYFINLIGKSSNNNLNTMIKKRDFQYFSDTFLQTGDKTKAKECKKYMELFEVLEF